MRLLFVYGSLKQGVANEHINTGRRVASKYRTRDKFPLYLLGEGEVPCIVAASGTGHQVIGEVYEVNADDIARMDRLERIGEPQGYERVEVLIERFDLQPLRCLPALVYVKQEQTIPSSTRRIGPLAEYKPEDATRFQWRGAA